MTRRRLAGRQHPARDERLTSLRNRVADLTPELQRSERARSNFIALLPYAVPRRRHIRTLPAGHPVAGRTRGRRGRGAR